LRGAVGRASRWLATYRAPKAAGVTEEAELPIVRAGGGTEANLQRWAEQFTEPKGAVVETDAGTYFFKLAGPASSVHAASADR
jgi:hypothetical protein